MNKDKIKEALQAANDELHRIAWAHTGSGPRPDETDPKTSVLFLCSEALRELEVSDSPDMDGSYFIDKLEGFAYHRCKGPDMLGRWKHPEDAIEERDHLNAAFKAGRSSLTGIDIEQEARRFLREYYEILCKQEGVADAHGRIAENNAEITLKPCFAFARFILSIKDGKGGGDVPKTEPALSAVSPAAQEDAAPIAIAEEPWRAYIELMRNNGGGEVLAVVERPHDGEHWDYGFATPDYHSIDYKAWSNFLDDIKWWPMTWDKVPDLDAWIKEREEKDGAKLVYRSELPSPPSQAPQP